PVGSWKPVKVIAQYSRRTPVGRNLNVWPSVVNHHHPSKAIVREPKIKPSTYSLPTDEFDSVASIRIGFVSVETESDQFVPSSSTTILSWRYDRRVTPWLYPHPMRPSHLSSYMTWECRMGSASRGSNKPIRASSEKDSSGDLGAMKPHLATRPGLRID
ncbi:hypothetical protein CR513_13335, partial [Mucuna pruriens]